MTSERQANLGFAGASLAQHAGGFFAAAAGAEAGRQRPNSLLGTTCAWSCRNCCDRTIKGPGCWRATLGNGTSFRSAASRMRSSAIPRRPMSGQWRSFGERPSSAAARTSDAISDILFATAYCQCPYLPSAFTAAAQRSAAACFTCSSKSYLVSRIRWLDGVDLRRMMKSGT